MATYTLSILDILQTHSQGRTLDPMSKAGVKNIQQTARESIFGDMTETAGIEAKYREAFETGFCLNFMQHEICMETLPAWRMELMSSLWTNAEFVNRMFDTVGKEIFDSYTVTRSTADDEGESTGTSVGSGKVDTTGSGTTENTHAGSSKGTSSNTSTATGSGTSKNSSTTKETGSGTTTNTGNSSNTSTDRETGSGTRTSQGTTTDTTQTTDSGRTTGSESHSSKGTSSGAENHSSSGSGSGRRREVTATAGHECGGGRR